MAAHSELPELIDWLRETIEPLEGQQWQITLNSSGGMVEVMARIEQSKREDEGRGITTTITRITNAKFRIGGATAKRKVFSTD